MQIPEETCQKKLRHIDCDMFGIIYISVIKYTHLNNVVKNNICLLDISKHIINKH